MSCYSGLGIGCVGWWVNGWVEKDVRAWWVGGSWARMLSRHWRRRPRAATESFPPLAAERRTASPTPVCGWVGGWVGYGEVEEIKAVRMSYCE